MRNLEKWITTALLTLLLLPAMAQQKADTIYTFRFVAGEDMFYVPWSGNGEELNRLLSCVEQHKEAILDGGIPVEVDGYCTSQATDDENLAMAKIRSNRVKTEMILRGKLTEACFCTRNHAAEGNYVTVRIVIPSTPSEAELEAQRKAEAERLEAEKRAEEQRLAEEQRQAEAARQAAEKAEQERLAKEQAQQAEAGRLAAEQTGQTARTDVSGWYAGLQGGVPFGVSQFSSFGADKTRATLSRENDPFWWKNSNDITVSAWWPYDADNIAQMPAVVVREDQSTLAAFQGSDFIFAENQTVNYGAPTLHFTHRTALVHIVLTEYTDDLESVRLTGLSTEGGNPGIIIPYDKGNHTYSALVLPQEVKAGMAFIACAFTNGKTFGYRMQESVEWTAGEEYTYTVSLVAANPVGYTYDEATNTYTVYNANGLLAWNEAARNDLTLNCTLAADINMTGIDWTPVGYFDYENWQFIGYTGTFDGGGHTITGLTVDLPNQEDVGLIGCLGGKVQNLTLAEVEINGSNKVGGVAGLNYGTVTACYATGDVSGTYYVGGVVGYNYGTLTACYATGNVSGNGNVGGVVGYNYGTLTACYWSNKLDAGVGSSYSGIVNATKVDDTDIPWEMAQSGMNEAIDAWNDTHSYAPCNWRYAGATETTPPTLAENK